MPAPKGSKKFYNPETGEVIIRLEHPGNPWIKGIPDDHVNARGMLVWHNPDTGDHVRRAESPGDPWLRGWHPDRLHSCGNGNRGKRASKETVEKRVKSLISRHRTEGLSESEKEGHRRVAEKLKNQTIPLEQRAKISKKLKGRKTGYNPKRSKSVSKRLNCDAVYLLKVETPEGVIFGKWGSTRMGGCRWRELLTLGCIVEVVGLYYKGGETPDLEEWVGSILSSHPAELGTLKFGGYTETFEWTDTTQNLLKEIINELEKGSSPQR